MVVVGLVAVVVIQIVQQIVVFALHESQCIYDKRDRMALCLAMLARCCSYGRVSVCLFVCLSVRSWCSIETGGRIELVFAMEA